MKLLLCLKCSDIFSLRTEKERTCLCGSTKGKYIDNLNAEISGPCMPIGFANSSFLQALKMQRIENFHQKEPTCCEGVDFIAFFIHNCASSIKRTDDLKDHIHDMNKEVTEKIKELEKLRKTWDKK